LRRFLCSRLDYTLVTNLDDIMTKAKERAMPTSLILNDLELKPYLYKEDQDFNGRLRIDARLILSTEEYSKIGKLPEIVKVTRFGIDETPIAMELTENAWSRLGDKIKDDISLEEYNEDEIDRSLWAVNLRNSRKLLIEQSIIIDKLLITLVSNGLIDEIKMQEIKTGISREKVLEVERGFNYSEADIDRFEF
jgi:hypothetical protein